MKLPKPTHGVILSSPEDDFLSPVTYWCADEAEALELYDELCKEQTLTGFKHTVVLVKVEKYQKQNITT